MTSATSGPASRAGTLRRRLFGRASRPSAPSPERLIAVVVILVAAYFVPRGVSWNADTHIFLTASMVDRGSITLDPFAHFTGDIAFAHGHYYADKAPGLSLLMIPVYALLKYTLLGGHTYASLFALPPAARDDFLVRYLLTLVYAGIPTGILCVLLYRFLGRFEISNFWRALVALTYGLGTFARAFAGELFSHQLSALLVFGAFLLLYRIQRGEVTQRAQILVGLLLGTAIITEYPTALIVLAIMLYALAGHHAWRKTLARIAAGALPPLVIGALYNTLAFGGPLSLGYAHLDGPQSFRLGQAQGFFGITAPHLDALWQTTFGPYRGIFLLSPVLLLAIPGFVLLWRKPKWRRETLLWLAIVVIYGLFSVSYYAWNGGYSMGPRQFLPALPFLMVPVGAFIAHRQSRRWRALVLILAACSIIVVELAAAVDPLVAPSYRSPLTQWVLPRLAGLTPDPSSPSLVPVALWHALLTHAPLFVTARLDNNWGMLFGLPGLLQLVPLLVLVAMFVLQYWQAVRHHARVSATRTHAATSALPAQQDIQARAR